MSHAHCSSQILQFLDESYNYAVKEEEEIEGHEKNYINADTGWM